MVITHIKINKFGDVEFFSQFFNTGLNVIETRFTSDVAKAIELVLCRKTVDVISLIEIERETFITADVFINGEIYFVEMKTSEDDATSLMFRVTGSNGEDVTNKYRQTMAHCGEQDVIELFDGNDKSFPSRFFLYRDRDSCDSLSELINNTDYAVETKTFRNFLAQYIGEFQPETINDKKDYKAIINEQGIFEVTYPGVSGEIHLSLTEEKLFLYLCFLNIAEFWEKFEKIRDMHHEKKPLLIKNFLEFLDETTNVEGLILRTLRLDRQVLILTLPKRKENNNELFYNFSSEILRSR